jgi:thioredoxin 1
MGYANATIANAEDYQRVLSTPRPVFLLFVSSHCAACSNAVPLFKRIAGEHPEAVSLVLDCAETPKHPEVTGTPTLLVYLNGLMAEKARGFGPEPEQAQFVEGLFKRYASH